MPALIPEHFQKSTWWRRTKSRNAAFSPNTPNITALRSISHYHSRLRWLHDRLGIKRSLNVVCWRQVKFEALIWIQANGEIGGGMLARGLTSRTETILETRIPLIDRFLFRQLTKTSINFLSRTEYFSCLDVRSLWWICQYTNCAFRMELFCTSCNSVEQIRSEKPRQHYLAKKFPASHGIRTFISAS
jgi:hypothetical protein